MCSFWTQSNFLDLLMHRYGSSITLTPYFRAVYLLVVKVLPRYAHYLWRYGSFIVFLNSGVHFMYVWCQSWKLLYLHAHLLKADSFVYIKRRHFDVQVFTWYKKQLAESMFIIFRLLWYAVTNPVYAYIFSIQL